MLPRITNRRGIFSRRFSNFDTGFFSFIQLIRRVTGPRNHPLQHICRGTHVMIRSLRTSTPHITTGCEFTLPRHLHRHRTGTFTNELLRRGINSLLRNISLIINVKKRRRSISVKIIINLNPRLLRCRFSFKVINNTTPNRRRLRV